MIEIPRITTDGARRARRHAFQAIAAAKRHRNSGLEREISQDGDQPDARSALRRDKEVISPDPPEAGFNGHGLMRNVGSLVLPIDDLRSRDGQSSESPILNMIGHQESRSIEEVVHLAVMMEIKGGRLIPEIFEDGIRKAFGQSDCAGEARAESIGEKKFVANPRYIGAPEEGEPGF